MDDRKRRCFQCRLDKLRHRRQRGLGRNFFRDATANKGLYAAVENVVVGEDGTLTLTIQGDGSKGYGLTALNYLSLTQVPEPATAALSLLGAAALFLRRRRD